MHAVLLLPLGNAGAAAGLVQGRALPFPRRQGSARRLGGRIPDPDFGVSLPKDTEIRVWDSTAETRFLVLPMRPEGTEGWSEAQLAEIVTRVSMILTGFPTTPGAPS